MKIIFLDFDDVINGAKTPKIDWVKHGHPVKVRGLDPNRVERVNEIYRAHPDAVFIICSSWRSYCDMDELKTFLWGAGAVFVDAIVGTTPECFDPDAGYIEFEREEEIDQWFENYYRGGGAEIDAFVILDNEPCHHFQMHQVQPRERVGIIKPAQVARAIKILSRPVAPHLTRAGREKGREKRRAEMAKERQRRLLRSMPGAWKI